MKADICQVRLRVPRTTEAACLGAAVLAAVGAGLCHDVLSCIDHAVRGDRVIEPQPKETGRYDRRYGLYRKLYPALSPLHGEVLSWSD